MARRQAKQPMPSVIECPTCGATGVEWWASAARNTVCRGCLGRGWLMVPRDLTKDGALRCENSPLCTRDAGHPGQCEARAYTKGGQIVWPEDFKHRRAGE